MTNTSRSKELATRLSQRIKEEGAITFRDWMEVALYDPSAGYYCRPNHDRWGREGDYRTSPERSSLFAATFARYLEGLHQNLDSPREWTIVETGGGAGHLAAGVLEKLKRSFPQVLSATRWVIDELSSDSSSQAQSLLADYEQHLLFRRLTDLEVVRQGVVFANEVLDAFPVHRLTVEAGELCEFYVGLNQEGDFEWRTGPLSERALIDYLDRNNIKLKDGQIAEMSLEVAKWLRLVAEKLEKGYLILVDYGAHERALYGPERSQGTLRAFYKHNLIGNVLDRVGEQDITSTVNWSFVTRISRELGFQVVEFKRQDQFLLQWGLLHELESSLSDASDEGERLKISTGAREMILPEGMAANFQVLVLKKS